MQLVPNHKITKARLGGKPFLYNPKSFQDTIAVTYNDLKMGMSYPVMTYGGGDRRTVTFDIYLNDYAEKGITKSFIAHLHSYLPPASTKGYQFRGAKPISFAFGWFVKDCWLTEMNTNYTKFSPQLEPIEATVTVTLAIIQ